METLLCETENINKNPKYRIIKYKDEYLMIDLISTWLALFFPMINWLIPKKYVKISEKDFETLNIVKTTKINSFWPVAGSTVLFGVMLRRYSHLFIVKYEYSNFNLLHHNTRYFSVIFIFKSKVKVTNL